MRGELPFHLMLIIPVVLVFIYCYLPMFGIVIAFQDFVPTAGGFIKSILSSRFSGLDNFASVLGNQDSILILRNTLVIAVFKIATKLFFSVVFALLLNEIRRSWLKNSIITITYFPYFLSWVVLGWVLLDFFSPRDGLVNQILGSLGAKSFYFFGDSKAFPFMVIGTDLWKEIGFNTSILLAALAGLDPTLYEAARVDGANRWEQTRAVTLPGIMPMVVLLMILSLGNVLNAGFDQIFNLLNPAVYSTGDIIDTYVYRLGLERGLFAMATAVGLFKSVISFILISLSYWFANRYSNYRLF